MKEISEVIEGGKAWLILMVTSDNKLRSFGGYNDVMESYYSWDSTVQNHANVKVGDLVILRDRDWTYGYSIIESIECGTEVKMLPEKCPNCKSAAVKARANHFPKWRCQKCKSEFEDALLEQATVRTYRAWYEPAWTFFEVPITTRISRSWALSPKSQLSIRELDPDLITGVDAVGLRKLSNREMSLKGGKVFRTVAVRIGQSEFRKQLIATYGRRCIFTGPCPSEALEAAHLYSYAEVGKHHSDGGFLMRRDFHSLFDKYLVGIDPSSLRIEVSTVLEKYPEYAAMAGKIVDIRLTEKQKDWLEAHFSMFQVKNEENLMAKERQ